MAQQDKATLKASMESGDTPDGDIFANLVDSQLNLQETTAQTINGPVVFAGGASFAAISAAVVGGAAGTFSSLAATAATIITLTATNLFGLAKGELYGLTGGTCAFASLSAFMPLTAMTTTAEAAPILTQFTHNGSGRLTYTGVATKNFLVDVDFTVLAVTGLQRFEAGVGVNGAVQAKTGITFKATTVAGQAPNAGHFGGLITLTANSFIEVMAQAVLNVSDIQFTKLSVRIREV